MAMGEDDHIYRTGFHRQVVPIELAQVFYTLKKSAINQDFFLSGLHQILGTGNGAGCAQKVDVDVG